MPSSDCSSAPSLTTARTPVSRWGRSGCCRGARARCAPRHWRCRRGRRRRGAPGRSRRRGHRPAQHDLGGAGIDDEIHRGAVDLRGEVVMPVRRARQLDPARPRRTTACPGRTVRRISSQSPTAAITPTKISPQTTACWCHLAQALAVLRPRTTSDHRAAEHHEIDQAGGVVNLAHGSWPRYRGAGGGGKVIPPSRTRAARRARTAPPAPPAASPEGG